MKKLGISLISLIWLICLIAIFALHARVTDAASLSVSISVGMTYFRIEGFSSPGSTITLKENGAVIATATPAEDGSFSVAALGEDGIHTYQIYALDPSGRLTPTISYTVSLVPGTTTAIGNLVLPPTLHPDTVDTALGEDIHLEGYGVPSSDIQIFFDSSLMATVKTDTAGHYNGLISSGNYTEGTHPLIAKNALPGGYNSADSFPYTVTLRPRRSVSTAPAGSSPQASATPQKSPASKPVLPGWLARFDTDGDGHLTLAELKSSVTNWVMSWTKTKSGTCDLNSDNICDLYDLSILLYYIGR